jgi:hypothetical protein
LLFGAFQPGLKVFLAWHSTDYLIGSGILCEVPPSAQEILADIRSQDLEPAVQRYAAFHARRFESLLAQTARLLQGCESPNVLSIGPGLETVLLRKHQPHIRIETLGFLDLRFTGVEDAHYEYDLNRTLDPASWPSHGPYDLVLMPEVIEHLPTPAFMVLCSIACCLKASGRLLLQTPNAVCLGKRKEMLLGRQPYEPLRDTPQNPGHFREYTLVELVESGRLAGLEVEYSFLANYFREKTGRERLYDFLCAILPGELHDGLTIVYRPRVF